MLLYKCNSEFPPGRAPSWTALPGTEPHEMEIFLFEQYFIHAIETQGAGDRQEWVTKYKLMYRLTDSSVWHYYRDSDGQEVVSLFMLNTIYTGSVYIYVFDIFSKQQGTTFFVRTFV